MITIINYGAGNIKSIQNMLKRIGEASVISNNIDDILKSEKLILPGVGHFDYGMRQLKNSGLLEVLSQKVLVEKLPILGICLGAQMLGNGSEEGSEKGLGWINMDVIKFDITKIGEKNKIPAMGWKDIQEKKPSKLLNGYKGSPRFYFVHSYHMMAREEKDVLATANYGYEYTAAVERDNVYGVQFHPEKSHKYGINLLQNFVKI